MKEFTKYTLLKNKVYLYLLCYGSANNYKINCTRMAEELGLSRKTAAKQLQEVVNEDSCDLVEINDEGKIEWVYNRFYLDVFLVKDVLKAQLSDVATAYVLRKSIDSTICNKQFYDEMRMSVQGFYNHKEEIDEAMERIKIDFILLISKDHEVKSVEKGCNVRRAVEGLSEGEDYVVIKRCVRSKTDEVLRAYRRLIEVGKGQNNVGLY